MSKWQAIIFDLDDTLYPEREYVFSGFRAVAEWAEEHLNIPKDDGFLRLTKLFMEGVRGDTFNRWLSSYRFQRKAKNGNQDNLVFQLVAVYREHEPQISPFPEVTDVLGRLQGQFLLGLLSDGYLEVQKRKLEALSISGFFDEILFTDELGRQFWKPSPVPFDVILQRLKVKDPKKAVYIADNPQKDFLGANQIGMGTIWYRYPDGVYSNTEPTTQKHKPDEQISSLKEIFTLV